MVITSLLETSCVNANINTLTLVLEKQILEEDIEKINVIMDGMMENQKYINIYKMDINEYERLSRIIEQDFRILNLNVNVLKSIPPNLMKYITIYQRYKAYIINLNKQIEQLKYPLSKYRNNLYLIEKYRYRIDEINQYLYNIK